MSVPGSLTARLQKLRGRSFKELRERAGQALWAELERRGVAGPGGEPGERALRSALDPRATHGATSAVALHDHFRTRHEPAFFAGVRDGSTARALRGGEWTTARVHLLAAADRILEGKFDLLGHTGLSYGNPIDWHLDPVTRLRAPGGHWSRIPYLDAARVGDHKVIWEINRHQHFVVLGRAWQVEGSPRYAEYFADQVTSWMDANPPKQGINWASSLEVSYRAIAWLWAIELFRDAPELTPTLLGRMLKYLEVHGRHLERYPSTYFSPNTHLTGEALGLLYLGTMLPELKRSRRWREMGWRILVEQLPKQVHPDGVYFEQATYYHRYTADIYLHAVLLAQVNGLPVPEPMRERLTLALDHLADLTRPDGTIPIIGDDDGGRLVNLEERAFMDVRAVLGTAAVVLDRPELAAVAGSATEEVVWMLGPTGAATVKEMSRGPMPARESSLFARGGYAIMRDGWDREAMHAVIDCGPLGALNCGHAHSDALSVELSAGGCSLVVDPGTYSYTGAPDARDHFRHSAAHNALTLNGEAASVPAGPFSWEHRTDAQVVAWHTGSIADAFVGSHAGFDRLGVGADYRRFIWFVRGEYWLVLDRVASVAPTVAVSHYHAALGAKVDEHTGLSAVVRVPCRAGWRRLFFAAAGDVEPILWGEDWVSPSYGSRAQAPHAQLTSRGSGVRQLVAVLCPVGAFEHISVQEPVAEKGRLVVVNRQKAYDQWLFSTDGQATAEGMELRGDAALIRREARDGRVNAIALYGRDALVEVDGMMMTAKGAAEAVRGADGWKVTGQGRVAATT